MSLELLKLLSAADLYERYKDFINQDALTLEERLLFDDMQHWFKDYPQNPYIDFTEFKAYFFNVLHPTIKQEKAQIYTRIIDRLTDTDVSEEFSDQIIEKWLKREALGKIADLAMRGYTGEIDPDVEEIEHILDDFDHKSSAATGLEECFVKEGLADLAEELNKTGYKWGLSVLNQAIGELHDGDFVLIGARPNAGKTSFALDQVKTIAPQLPDNRPAIYFCNEESGKKVKVRAMQAALGMNNEEIMEDPVMAEEEFNAIYGDSIQIMYKSDMYCRDIETILKRTNAGLVVIDQIWKLKGFNRERNAVDVQTKIYSWGRELAAKHGVPVIALTQLGESAEGKQWPVLSTIYGSKTAAPGELDFGMLLGKINKPGRENDRFLNIAKAKAAYGPDVDPNMAEGKFKLRIDKQTGRFYHD
jgi:replicative DNA helicase